MSRFKITFWMTGLAMVWVGMFYALYTVFNR